MEVKKCESMYNLIITIYHKKKLGLNPKFNVHYLVRSIYKRMMITTFFL